MPTTWLFLQWYFVGGGIIWIAISTRFQLFGHFGNWSHCSSGQQVLNSRWLPTCVTEHEKWKRSQDSMWPSFTLIHKSFVSRILHPWSLTHGTLSQTSDSRRVEKYSKWNFCTTYIRLPFQSSDDNQAQSICRVPTKQGNQGKIWQRERVFSLNQGKKI